MMLDCVENPETYPDCGAHFFKHVHHMNKFHFSKVLEHWSTLIHFDPEDGCEILHQLVDARNPQTYCPSIS